MATLYTLKSTENHIFELKQLTGLSFQRAYWIYQVPTGELRGKHTHRKNHSVLFCLTGSVRVFIQSIDDEASYPLNRSNQALHIIPEDWRMLYDFSPDCIVLALANELFLPRIIFLNRIARCSWPTKNTR